MTPKPPPNEMATWLRRLDQATAKHAATRVALEGLIADARTAGVPLSTIAEHVPYSREWARKLADEVDAKRAAAQEHAPPAGKNEWQPGDLEFLPPAPGSPADLATRDNPPAE